MSATSAKVLAAVALVATFMVGIGVGFVADRVLIMHGMTVPHPSTAFLVRRLDRHLHFNDQQRAQVTVIINRHQQRIAGIWSGVRPAVHDEIEAANIEIDRLLTPEQRITFGRIRMRLMPRHGGDGIRRGRD